MRQDPEQRLEDYLRRCVEEHYKGDESQRLRDLGITDDVVYLGSDPDKTVAKAVLARIEAQS